MRISEEEAIDRLKNSRFIKMIFTEYPCFHPSFNLFYFFHHSLSLCFMKVTEEEAVDLLARSSGVLLMPGTPFGAPQHMRLSYGGLPPDAAMSAVQRLSDGFDQLMALSASR